MSDICANCPHPSYCRYKDGCSPNYYDGSLYYYDDRLTLPEPDTQSRESGFENATDEVRKATPIDAIFKFWPDAMVALAQHIWKGNEKYNPEHPKIGWIREKSSDHVGSMTRHLCYDYVKASTREAKIKVMSAIAWRALAELQLLTEEKDDE